MKIQIRKFVSHSLHSLQPFCGILYWLISLIHFLTAIHVKSKKYWACVQVFNYRPTVLPRTFFNTAFHILSIKHDNPQWHNTIFLRPSLLLAYGKQKYAKYTCVSWKHIFWYHRCKSRTSVERFVTWNKSVTQFISINTVEISFTEMHFKCTYTNNLLPAYLKNDCLSSP